MATFALVNTLGWAHQGSDIVLCKQVTFRDHDMYVPGGSLITGIVVYDYVQTGIDWYNQKVPRIIKKTARLALVENDKREEEIRENEDWSPSRLSYLPVSLRNIKEEGASYKSLYIVCFTEDDAIKAAIKAGVEVRKGHSYPGPSGRWLFTEHNIGGSVWERLVDEQERRKILEKA